MPVLTHHTFGLDPGSPQPLQPVYGFHSRPTGRKPPLYVTQFTGPVSLLSVICLSICYMSVYF